MSRHHIPLGVGVALLLGSIGLDLLGTNLQSLVILIVSFICGIAGALIAVRGVIDLLSSRI